MVIVIKIGFEIFQGSLVCIMIYFIECVLVNNVEVLFFILFLFIFVFVVFWYVWDEGVKKDCKRFKFLLDCIFIIISVVFFEFFMEFSLVVNISLVVFVKFVIFCIEFFRIFFVGCIDVVCFDKIGIFIGEDFVVEGIVGFGLGYFGIDIFREIDGVYSYMIKVYDVGFEIIFVFVIVYVFVKFDEGEVVGDLMEKVIFNVFGWFLGKNDILISKFIIVVIIGIVGIVQIKCCFQFFFVLKCQSVVVIIYVIENKVDQRLKGIFVVVKGVFEMIMKMLVIVFKDYEEMYKYFICCGFCVLVLVYKYLFVDNEFGMSRINDLKCEKVELEFIFVGFLVFQCFFKDDVKEVVCMFNESSYCVVMIIGDNLFIVVYVVKEVEIVDWDVFILDFFEYSVYGEEKFVWCSVDDKV